MGLLEFLVERFAKAGYIPPDEQGQIIFVDLLVLVVKILPDKAALLPILGKGVIRQQLPILVGCV